MTPLTESIPDTVMAAEPRSRVRLVLVLLLLVFTLPIVAAFLWRPTGFVNHGELVQPPRLITDVSLQTLQGREFRFAELQSRWALIYFGGERCDDACHRTLHNTNQARLAQGKNLSRVNSVLILPQSVQKTVADRMTSRYPGLLTLTGTPRALGALISQFVSDSAGSAVVPSRVYVVDPLGNLMMSYPADADPTGIKKDLMRLLRVSQVG